MKKTAIGGSFDSVLELKIEAANIRRTLGGLLEAHVRAPLVTKGRDLSWKIDVCAGKSPAGRDLILKEMKQLDSTEMEIEFSKNVDSGEDQFLTIYREARVDSVMQYIPSDCKDWRWERIYGNKAALFRSDMAYLYPALHMAIYIGDTALSKEVVRSLKNAGYSFLKSKDYPNIFPESCKCLSSYEIEHEILSAQRRKNYNFSAVDARGLQILECLIKKLPEVIEYNFEIGTAVNKEEDYANFGMIIEDVFVYENCHSFTATPNEIRAGVLDNRCKGMQINEALLLCSRVKTVNRCAHIPLVCFNYSPCDTHWIRNKLMHYSNQWIIADAESSTQFYGTTLLDENDWREFMKTCLDTYPWVLPYEPITPPHLMSYINQGYSTLRLTPTDVLRSQPCFIELWKPNLGVVYAKDGCLNSYVAR